MKYANFETLQDLHAHSETVTRFISASTMRLYLKATGLYLDLINMSETVGHSGRELALLVVTSLNSPNADGKDFNFIQGTTFGDNNIDELENMKLLLSSRVDDIDLLKTLVVNHCNQVIYPYVDVTQEEFDADKASGETEVTHVLYEGQDVKHLVTVGKKLLKFAVTLDSEATYDATVNVTATGRQNKDSEYLPLTRTFSVDVKAGELGAFSIDQAIAYFPRHVKFTATIDKKDTPFTLDVLTS